MTVNEMVSYLRDYRITLADYLALPEDEDREREVIKGRLFVSPKPSKEHQWLLVDLAVQLIAQVAQIGGDRRQVLPDADLIIDERGTYVSPDIMYFTQSDLERLLAGGRGWVDAKVVRPTLVVELVSPSSTARDVTEKLPEYEAIGIPFYWVSGPDPRRFREFELDSEAGRYRLRRDQVGGSVVPILFSADRALSLDLDALDF